MSNTALQQNSTKTKQAIEIFPKDLKSPKTTSVIGVEKSEISIERNRVFSRKRKRSKHPLRELRIRAGMTLEELAISINSSPSYLSRLESGARRLNSDTIERLSKALSCNPAELLPQSTFGTSATFGTPSTSSTSAANTNMVVDLPVYALDGSKKNNNMNTKTTEQWAARPSELQGVSSAFACVIKNSAWKPRYYDGEKLMIHPTAPLRPGVTVLLTTNEGETLIGRLIEFIGDVSTGMSMVIERSFDEDSKTRMKKMTYAQKEIHSAYRIIASIEA